MDYESGLKEARASYPFDRWKSYAADGLEQYSEENCEKARGIFDALISDLSAAGEDVLEEIKILHFQAAVEALNALNDSTDGALIETGEREELCELINRIAEKAGIDPGDYGDGEGPASEWREW